MTAALDMLVVASQKNGKNESSEATDATAAASEAAPSSVPTTASKNDPLLLQPAPAQQTNGATTAPDLPSMQQQTLITPQPIVAAAIAPSTATASTTTIPMMQPHQQLPNLLFPSAAGTTATAASGNKNILGAKSIPNAPGIVRGGPNGAGGGQLLQFPWKLHEMLHVAEKDSKLDVISWLPGGNGFKVHNKERFCSEMMPGYFASQKYKTFQRSLNYGDLKASLRDQIAVLAIINIS